LDPQLVDADKPKIQPRNLVFELHGSLFENRAVDRATRKFKHRRMDEL